ncbi:MAG: hypothetical protein DRQ78_05420 [Epsilonproteobacteria bacterium]|nr:MAG: hypothetical protein DRQ78_05420 [Campylobacterota bacterium]
MNSLIVHNDNVTYLDDFTHKIKFKTTNEIDKYISDDILLTIKEINPDVIFIKDNLSEHYLELIGIRLAYHVRLSRELGDLRFLPIVILSDLDSFMLNKINSMSRIFFTKNTFTISNNRSSVEAINNKPMKNMSVYEYNNDFMNSIDIATPDDSSEHSITNSWAIYQWSNLLGLSTEIFSKLHFKYLIAKHQLQNKSKNSIHQKQKSGNILLIDDKWSDGWKEVLNEFTVQQYTDVTLDILEYKFKDKTIESIKEVLNEKLNVLIPDIILLDLRLLESDNIIGINDKKSINRLSGIQIIGEIKKINLGIQIIMFTASGDSLILEEIHNKGVLGYVKKDAPTDKYESSKNSFKKLDTLIKKGIDKNYLKKIWKLEKDILRQPFLQNTKELSSENQQVIFELRKNIQFVFEILNSNVPNPFVYAMLAIFKSIELLNDYYIEEEWMKNKKYSFWKGSGNKIQTLDYGTLRDTKDGDYNLSSENKIMAIIKENTSIQEDSIDNDIKQFICSRNYAMHPSEKDSCRDFLIKEPKAEHIVGWFEMLYKITSKIQNKKNIL